MSSVWKHIFVVTIAIGLLLITAQWAARAALPTPVGVIVIDDDNGGGVDDHLRWWTRVLVSGVPVRFHGMCISSCTIGLLLPKEQMCVEPTASFGFHLASSDGIADPEFTRALYVRVYPPVVQEWLSHQKLTLERIIFLTAAQIVKMGVMDYCESSPKP